MRVLISILVCIALLALLRNALPGCDDPAQHPAPSPPPRRRAQLVLAMGVITAPGHFTRRVRHTTHTARHTTRHYHHHQPPLHPTRQVWMRQKLRVTEARQRGVRVLFVLGSRNHMTAQQRTAVRYETRSHRDVIFVPARDYLPHAVAEKSLGWWLYAADKLNARWIGKTDDDSLCHLPRLEHDLRLMSQLGRSHYYYGVMTWRCWYPFHSEPDGVCGARGDDGPSLDGPGAKTSTLNSLLRQCDAGGECGRALGPFPFADGSLQVLSRDLMEAFTSTRLARNFSRAHSARAQPPFWTHEDAGVGYLIFHTAMMHALPLTYVVLSAWRHNKFWINWYPRRNPSIPDGHVVNTHKIVSPMMAQIALDAYENTTYAADPLLCNDCRETWGWTCCHDKPPYGRVPIEKFACCNKKLD